MDDPQATSIRTLVEPLLADQRMELVELTCRPQSGGLLLRLLVDQVGGVTIRDCARMNQILGEALERSGLMAEDHYMLEVSSPGLDRPLVSRRDYERALGVVAAGRIDVTSWVREFPLEEGQRIMDQLTTAPGDLVKASLMP